MQINCFYLFYLFEMKNVSDLEIKTLTCKLSHVLCYTVIF